MSKIINGLYRNKKTYADGDKIIFITFPGFGKTCATEKHPNFFIEVNAENYEFYSTININDGMLHDDDWYKYYVDEIERILEDDSIEAKIVLVSSNIEVVEELTKRGIRFCFLLTDKDNAITNCIQSGHSSQFVEWFSEEFDYINDTIRKSTNLSFDCSNICFFDELILTMQYRVLVNIYLNNK